MTMNNRLRSTRAIVALVTSANLAASSWLPAIHAKAAQTAAPKTTTQAPAAAAKPAAKPAVPPPPDGGWPRQYVTKSGVPFLVYQPQIASWDDQKRMTAYAAVAYSAQGASTTKPDLGTVKVEANTKVSLAERLVSFSDFKITEANFSTLKKEQTAEIAKEITEGFPVEDRVIALDRVLQSIDTSKIIPRNIEGIKADPPTDLLQQEAGRARQLRRRAHLERREGPRPQVCRQHELGPLPAHADQHVLPAQRPDVDEGDRAHGRLAAGGRPARELQEAAGRRELEGHEGGRARQEGLGIERADRVRVDDARRADSAQGRAGLPARSKARP